MMDEVQTGQDTLRIQVGAGTSRFDDPDVSTDGDINPDYINDEIAYYFTGDMNLSGTMVKNKMETDIKTHMQEQHTIVGIHIHDKVTMVEQHLGIKIVY